MIVIGLLVFLMVGTDMNSATTESEKLELISESEEMSGLEEVLTSNDPASSKRSSWWNCWNGCGRKGGACYQESGCRHNGICCRKGNGPSMCQENSNKACRFYHCCVYPPNGLIRNTWSDLKNNIDIRFYSPNNKAGVKISFDALNNQFSCPGCVFATRKLAMYVHGFNAKPDPTFIERYKNDNLIMVNWNKLAQFITWSGPGYDNAAKNSIDVGRYIGKLLVEMCRLGLVEAKRIHLIGHSLGAHVVGNAARTFKLERKDEEIDRLTALDPAGPRFIDGPTMKAIPELDQNRLRCTDASFVDVIHTNGGIKPCVVCFLIRMGDLHQMGDVDFYVGAGAKIGEFQPGCNDVVCSHIKAKTYFLASIQTPSKYTAKQCASLDSCRKGQVIAKGKETYMGESTNRFTGRTMFYVDPQEGTVPW